VLKLQHPFLIALHFSFQTSTKLYLVLEYVNGGELFFHLQKCRVFGEARSRFYAAEITSALTYLHSNNVIYRDLKPENILLDARGHIKLTDFGLAKEGAYGSTFCGTPEYLAPEILQRQVYGKEVDWWCLGSVLFEMLVGLPPFYHKENDIMFNRILNSTLEFPDVVGSRARGFISRLMRREPEERLGFGVFGSREVMCDPFWSGIDWDKVVGKVYMPPFNPEVVRAIVMRNLVISAKFDSFYRPIQWTLATSMRVSQLSP